MFIKFLLLLKSIKLKMGIIWVLGSTINVHKRNN